MIELSELSTPVGALRVAMHKGQLVGMAFIDQGWERVEAHLRRRFPDGHFERGAPPSEVDTSIGAYMAGELHALDRLEIDLGGREFQRRVWEAIRRIPAGQTWSYGQLAAETNAARAVRAAGTACGANPLVLVIPCHRVVRASGALGDYGGGLDRKEWLLAHEREQPH